MYGHTDLKKGVLVELDGAPQLVLESSHVATGRGSGVMRVKFRNLFTNSVTEKSFRASDKLPPAEVERVNMQYLYQSGDDFAFMNDATYDQETLSAETVGDAAQYLTEGSIVQLMRYNGRIISLEMPNSVFLKITETGDGAKGDTANAALKPAVLETGAEVMVPMFVKQGDVIKVDTYLERQK